MVHDNHKIKNYRSLLVKEIHKSQRKTTGEESYKGSSKLKTVNKTAIVHPHLSILPLNINGSNSPTKSHRVAEQIKRKQNKTRPSYMLFTILSTKDRSSRQKSNKETLDQVHLCQNFKK